MRLWGVQWRSQNLLDGKVRHLLYDQGLPLVFRTRADANGYIRERYGYIATRADLRAEPHGWRMPHAVRVEVIVREGA